MQPQHRHKQRYRPMEVVYSNQLVSVFNGFKQSTPAKDMTFAEFIALGSIYKDQISQVRDAATKEERSRLKALLPSATIAGTFHPTRQDGALQQPSFLMCIDIDKKENPWCHDWQQFKDWLCEGDDYIFFASISVSGEGLFVVYPITHPELFELHYKAVERRFAAYDITIDASCKNVSRLRVLSYDEQPYWNEFATPFDEVYKEPAALPPAPMQPQQPTPAQQPFQASQRPQPYATANYQGQDYQRPYSERKGSTVIDKVDKCCSLITQHGIDITSSYDDWYKVGMALASLGEQGRNYFHTCSRQYPRYSYQETNLKFDNFLRTRNTIEIGTFFQICRDYGICFKE